MSQLVLPWPEASFWRNWFLRIAGVVFVLYIAYVVREIWLPLGLAFLLATILDPVVDRMERKGWKRSTGTAFIFFTFIAFVVGIGVLAFPFVADQLVTVQGSIQKYFPPSALSSVHELTVSLIKLRVPRAVASPIAQSLMGLQNGLLKSSSSLSEYGLSFLGNMVWVIFIPIVGFYALRDYHLLLGKALLLAPRRHRNSVQIYVAEVSGVFSRYLRGLAIVSFLNGIATWVLLAALHVPNSLLLGLLAGILYSVPYIGALITVAMTAAMAFVGGGVSMLVYAVAASIVLHQIIFDQIITPRILGGHVGIHPIVSIVALLVGNLLLGIVGMVLAVPVAACIQIGVLALVPKLRQTIDLDAEPNAHIESEVRSEQTKEDHLLFEDQSASHGNLLDAVEQIEAQMEAEPTVSSA